MVRRNRWWDNLALVGGGNRCDVSDHGAGHGPDLGKARVVCLVDLVAATDAIAGAVPAVCGLPADPKLYRGSRKKGADFGGIWNHRLRRRSAGLVFDSLVARHSSVPHAGDRRLVPVDATGFFYLHGCLSGSSWSSFCAGVFISSRCEVRLELLERRADTGALRSISMNTMPYLFAAYLAIWIILAIYLFSIHSREKKLREEVRRLKLLLEK